MSGSNGSSTSEVPNGVPQRFSRFDMGAMSDSDLRSLAVNIQSRQDWLMSALTDVQRNIYTACKVSEPGTVTPQMYAEMFRFNAIAGRVCEVLPKECWQVQPTVYESKKAKEITAFEKAWDELGKDLRSGGVKSFYQDELHNPVWEYLSRVDILSGIGEYGVVLLGLGDNERDLSKEAKPKAGMKLNYLRCFTSYEATISRYETDEFSPRNGHPIEYQISVGNPDPYSQSLSGTSPPNRTYKVHWTRVIHVADLHHQPSSSEFLAIPRQQPVWHNLQGLQKLYLCSPEMHWKGALPGLALKTQAGAGDTPIDKEAIRLMMWKYENDLQRWIGLQNLDPVSLASQVADPSASIAIQIEAICIKGGYPVRIFKGSERGELASSQDDGAWNDRLKEREGNYITPRIIIPFVDRLIYLGVLPEPKGYSVEWPDLTSQTDQERATVASLITTAFATYVEKGLDALIPPLDYLTRIHDFEEADVKAWLEEAAQLQEDKAEEAAAAAEEQRVAGLDHAKEAIDKGLAPDPTVSGKPVKPPGLPPGKPPTANEDNTLLDAIYEELEGDEPIVNAKKAKLSGGRWVTIQGQAVYLKGGKIVAGPKALKDELNSPKGDSGKGKGSDSTPPKKHSEPSHDKKPSEHKTGKGEDKTDAKPGKTFTKKEDRGAAEAHAKETHGEWGKGLPTEQKKALETYAAEGAYKEINGGLRAGKVDDRHADTVKALDKAIDSAPPLSASTVMYRGVGAGMADKLKVGAEFEDKGYISTSHNRHVAEGFTEDAMIHVTVPKGTKMASIDASGTGKYKGEKSENEYILPRGTKFKVTKREKHPDGYDVIHVEAQ